MLLHACGGFSKALPGHSRGGGAEVRPRLGQQGGVLKGSERPEAGCLGELQGFRGLGFRF